MSAEISHNKRLPEVLSHAKRLPEVLSHAKCSRCNSNDKGVIASVGDNYNLRCKYCWYEWTESWRPRMTKEDKASTK